MKKLANKKDFYVFKKIKRLENKNRNYFLLTNEASGVTIRPYSKQPKAMMETSSAGDHPQRAGESGNSAADPV